MRIHGIAAVCPLILVACATENELRYTSTLDAETHGFVLSEDGLDGEGAMSGTTCTVDTTWACPTADADLPTTWERVLDSYQGTTLGASDLGVHTIVGGVWRPDEDEPLSDVRTARLWDGGRVVVRGDESACSVVRDDETLSAPGALCADRVRFSIDRATGVVLASSSAGAWRIEPTGAVSVPNVGDLTAWDPSLGLIFTATSGETALRAIDAQGEVRWEVDAGGPIVDLVARGRRDEVLVRLGGSGLSGIERRDGASGKLLGSSALPDDEGDMVVSDDGTTIAIVRPLEVDFYDLLTDGEKPRVDPTPVHCIVPTVGDTPIPIGD